MKLIIKRLILLGTFLLSFLSADDGKLGPDFNMVAYTRHKEEIEYYAKDPYSLYEAFGYTANAMPTLPLEDQQFKDVADYISSLQPFKKWMIKKRPYIVKNNENNESIDKEIQSPLNKKGR